jgi:hypothetical protein
MYTVYNYRFIVKLKFRVILLTRGKDYPLFTIMNRLMILIGWIDKTV